MDIAKEHPEKWMFFDLRTAFLNAKSSFQDDRNAIETGAIFPVFPWLTLWSCLGAWKREFEAEKHLPTGHMFLKIIELASFDPQAKDDCTRV